MRRRSAALLAGAAALLCAFGFFFFASARDAPSMSDPLPDAAARALDSDRAMPVSAFGARFPLPEPLQSIGNYHGVAFPSLHSTLQVRCYAGAASPGEALDLHIAEERYKIEKFAMLAPRDSLVSVQREKSETFVPGKSDGRAKNTASMQRAQLRYGSGSKARVAAFAFEAAGSPRVACPPVEDGRYRIVPKVAPDSARSGQRVWLLRWRPPGAKATEQQQALWMDVLRSVRHAPAAEGPGRLGLQADSARADSAMGPRLPKRFHAGRFSVGLPEETPRRETSYYFVSEERESEFKMTLRASIESFPDSDFFSTSEETIARSQGFLVSNGGDAEENGPIEVDGHSGYWGLTSYKSRSDLTGEEEEYMSALAEATIRAESPKKHLQISVRLRRSYWPEYEGLVEGILSRMTLEDVPIKLVGPHQESIEPIQ